MLVMGIGLFGSIILLRGCVVSHFSFSKEMGMNYACSIFKNMGVQK